MDRPAEPVAMLQRWLDFGGAYRVVSQSPGHAVVELQTCHGEAVDRLESDDEALLAYLEQLRTGH
jgi:hypothetical protein